MLVSVGDIGQRVSSMLRPIRIYASNLGTELGGRHTGGQRRNERRYLNDMNTCQRRRTCCVGPPSHHLEDRSHALTAADAHGLQA
jgi:hypothetical protein